MGHRANYAIRRDGALELFSSGGGALTIAQDAFWGPSYAEAVARAQAPCEEWLDEVWAEGGLALDFDRRRGAWFAAHELSSREGLREPFLRRMRVIWKREGWAVRRVEGQRELVEVVGVDPATVARDTSRRVYTPRQAGERTRRDGVVTFLLRVAGPDGVDERVGGSDLFALLPGGPAILELLDDLPTLEEVRSQEAARDPASETAAQLADLPQELLQVLAGAAGVSPAQLQAMAASQQPPRRPLGDRLTQGAWLDPAARVLRVVSLDRPLLGEDQSLARTWPAWDVSWRCAPLSELFTERGHALPDDLRSTLQPQPPFEPTPALTPRQADEAIARALFPTLDPSQLLDDESPLPDWPEPAPGERVPDEASARALFRLAQAGA